MTLQPRIPTSRPWLPAFLAIFLLVLLAAASPWLTPEWAAETAAQHFEQGWYQVADGCGFNCEDCGVTDVQRAVFGFRVSIEYACGLIPADLPEYHQNAQGFVSFLGSVHGLPVP